MRRARAERTRGEWRPVFQALWNGANFQELAPGSRLVLLAIKGNLHATGIACLPGLVDSCAAWTGLSARQVTKALQELQKSDWIRRERSVVWVVRGFEFEPTWDAANSNQAKHVRSWIDGLPRLPIVDQWRARYAQWLCGSPAPGAGGSPAPGATEGAPEGAAPRPAHGLYEVTPLPTPLPTPTPAPTAREAAVAAQVSLNGVAGYATRLAVAANLAIAERFGEQTRPIRGSHPDSYALGQELHDRGVPIEFAEQTIREVVSRYPEHREPPASLRYFARAITEAHDAARDPAVVASQAATEGQDPTLWARATTLLQELKSTGLHKAPFRSREKLLVAFVGQRWIADEARFRRDFGTLHVSARAMLEGKTDPQAVLAIVERLRAGVQEELPRHLREEGAEHPWLDWSGRAAAEGVVEGASVAA